MSERKRFVQQINQASATFVLLAASGADLHAAAAIESGSFLRRLLVLGDAVSLRPLKYYEAKEARGPCAGA
jgi:hypothetical protein